MSEVVEVFQVKFEIWVAEVFVFDEEVDVVGVGQQVQELDVLDHSFQLLIILVVAFITFCHLINFNNF